MFGGLLLCYLMLFCLFVTCGVSGRFGLGLVVDLAYRNVCLFV